MRGVARKKHAALSERSCHALVHGVEIAMHEEVAALLGKKSLQPALDGVLAQRLLVALFAAGGKEHAPEAVSIIAGDLEQGAPFLGIGEIIARALRIFGIEGEGGRK